MSHWKTPQEAADIIGVTPQDINDWTRSIDPNGDYTQDGIPLESYRAMWPHEDATSAKGSDIARADDGAISSHVVDGWRQSEQAIKD
ncbi:MAG: hypothetical protein KDJ52_04965 [Anaerolineae bacterium]|nr:hypothetical protein [Anaerolineae bacterium]